MSGRRAGAHAGGREASSAPAPADVRHVLALGQGVFYALTGLWALVSIGTFQMVTGPKTDVWLVKTVGVLVSVIGGVLALAGVRRQSNPEIALLAAGSATGLTAIDVVYSSRGRISKVYLLDALAETALVAAWGYAWLRRPRGGQ